MFAVEEMIRHFVLRDEETGNVFVQPRFAIDMIRSFARYEGEGDILLAQVFFQIGERSQFVSPIGRGICSTDERIARGDLRQLKRRGTIGRAEELPPMSRQIIFDLLGIFHQSKAKAKAKGTDQVDLLMSCFLESSMPICFLIWLQNSSFSARGTIQLYDQKCFSATLHRFHTVGLLRKTFLQKVVGFPWIHPTTTSTPSINQQSIPDRSLLAS